MTETARTAADLAATAAGFRAACRADGLTPPTSLWLLAHDTGAEPVPVDGPWDLGRVHERTAGYDERTRRGAWYTPSDVAVDLVERTVGRPGVVVDPACGGGVFLLAAADRLVTLGVPPSSARDLVVGVDVDAGAVAVSQAALWWWGARRGVPGVPDGVSCGDALVDGALPRATAVVGNPPFLGQLRSTTVAGADRRELLRARFGDVVAPYTDPAWLFLLAAVEALEPDGRATLIQPQSVLAARDASGVRRRVEELADLEACWVDDGTTFAASVDACAPTLRRRARNASGPASPNRWVAALADHRGVPDVAVSGAGTIADIAAVRSGFRDEYYGLVDAVTEGGPGPRLVTSGAIDPLRLRADRPTTFAKRRWTDPRIDVTKTSERARRWVESQREPSVLVASQTRILECLPDPDGDLVAGVPGLAVVPHDGADVWRVAAALTAPCVSARLLRATVGTGLSGDACRPTAAVVAGIPLPADAVAWDEAADLARHLWAAADAADRRWRDFGVVADRAYGVVDPALVAWWDRRRRGITR